MSATRTDAVQRKFFEAEVNCLLRLRHPVVLQILDYGQAVPYEIEGRRGKCRFLALELAPGGELLEYLLLQGDFAFGEQVARTYFKQLIDMIEHVHGQGLVHRDIKPENLLFDENFNLKLADFGFGTDKIGPNGDYMMQGRLGTLGYQAPELQHPEVHDYNGTKVDIFAAGVVLFVMVYRRPPFSHADCSDRFWQKFNLDNSAWWREHENTKVDRAQPPTDVHFRDLINRMLHCSPAWRPTLAEIKAHPWMQGPTADPKILQKELRFRHKIIQNSTDATATNSDSSI